MLWNLDGTEQIQRHPPSGHLAALVGRLSRAEFDAIVDELNRKIDADMRLGKEIQTEQLDARRRLDRRPVRAHLEPGG